MFVALGEAILWKTEFYEKVLQNGDPPPSYCFYEILIQKFYHISGTYVFLNKRYEIRLTLDRSHCRVFREINFSTKN